MKPCVYLEIEKSNKSIKKLINVNKAFIDNIFIINQALKVEIFNFDKDDLLLIFNDKKIEIKNEDSYTFSNDDLTKKDLLLIVNKATKKIISLINFNYKEEYLTNFYSLFIDSIDKYNSKLSDNDLKKYIPKLVKDVYKNKYKLHIVSEDIYFGYKRTIVNKKTLEDYLLINKNTLNKYVELDKNHYIYEAHNFNNAINNSLLILLKENLEAIKFNILITALINSLLEEDLCVGTLYKNEANMKELEFNLNGLFNDINNLILKLNDFGVVYEENAKINYSFFNIKKYENYFSFLAQSKLFTSSKILNKFHMTSKLYKVNNQSYFKFLTLVSIIKFFINKGLIFKENDFYYSNLLSNDDIHLIGDKFNAKVSILSNRRYKNANEKAKFYPSIIVEIFTNEFEIIKTLIIDFSLKKKDIKSKKECILLINDNFISLLKYRKHNLIMNSRNIDLYLYLTINSESKFYEVVKFDSSIESKYISSIAKTIKYIFNPIIEDIIYGEEII